MVLRTNLGLAAIVMCWFWFVPFVDAASARAELKDAHGTHVGEAMFQDSPEGVKMKAHRAPFRIGEALAAIWQAKWELLLPIFVVGSFFSGIATLVESAPMAALYTLIVQRFITRDLKSWGELLRVMSDCVALVGSVLIILAVAALTYLTLVEVVKRRLLGATAPADR